MQLNVNEMFHKALTATRINMTPAEQRQFFDKYIKKMHLVIDENGNASIELNVK